MKYSFTRNRLLVAETWKSVFVIYLDYKKDYFIYQNISNRLHTYPFFSFRQLFPLTLEQLLLYLRGFVRDSVPSSLKNAKFRVALHEQSNNQIIRK